MSEDGPWVRFFPSDWLAGTRGMTASETGVYITLCALMYERGGRVPNEPARLARLCGASNSAFKKALQTLLDEGKITEHDGYLSNSRVVEELSYSREKSALGREAAKSRWGKKHNENNDTTDADAMPAQCQRNANQKSEPSKVSKDTYKVDNGDVASAYQELKAIFPKRNPRHDWSKAPIDKFRKAAKEAGGAERILGAARAYAAEVRTKGNEGTEFVMMASSFINTRWRDYLPDEAPAQRLDENDPEYLAHRRYQLEMSIWHGTATQTQRDEYRRLFGDPDTVEDPTGGSDGQELSGGDERGSGYEAMGSGPGPGDGQLQGATGHVPMGAVDALLSRTARTLTDRTRGPSKYQH